MSQSSHNADALKWILYLKPLSPRPQLYYKKQLLFLGGEGGRVLKEVALQGHENRACECFSLLINDVNPHHFLNVYFKICDVQKRFCNRAFGYIVTQTALELVLFQRQL